MSTAPVTNAPTTEAAPRRQRYTHVDLLRGLAAMAVLFVHYRMFYPDGNILGPQTFTPEHQPFFVWLWPLYLYGNLAVQFFWALSGFVFMASYHGEERRIDPSRFAVWRFSRLYPLHFGTLIYLAAIQATSLATTGSYSVVPINDPFHFVLQLFLASNWGFESGYSFNAPIWSVSVEVLIYLVFLLFMRIGRTGVIGTAAMVGLFAVLDALLTSPIATCGFLFFTGAMLFHLAGWVSRWGPRRALLLALTGLLLASGVAAALARREGALASHVIMFICLPALLFTAATIDLSARPVPPRLRWIGDITYAVYLIHVPIIVTVMLLRRYGGTHYATPDQPWFLAVYLTGVIGAAAVVFRSFELPSQNAIRRRWRVRQAVLAARQAGENRPLASSSR